MNTSIDNQPASLIDTSLPKWVFLQLLEHCNLRCRMCYEWGDNGPYREKKTLRRLDIEIVERVIDECRPAQPYYEALWRRATTLSAYREGSAGDQIGG